MTSLFMSSLQVILQNFFPAQMDANLKDYFAFGIFAAGYLARPLGGIVIAHFGDKFGRKMFLC